MRLAVVVPLSVGRVVLLVVRHQVPQREPVVGAHKVDRGRRPAPAAPPRAAADGAPPVPLARRRRVDVGRPAQRRCEVGGPRRARPGGVRALDERADRVPEGAVPLGEAAAVVREGADLVEAVAVPGLGDQLDVPQRGVLGDRRDERRVRERRPRGDAGAVGHVAVVGEVGAAVDRRERRGHAVVGVDVFVGAVGLAAVIRVGIVVPFPAPLFVHHLGRVPGAVRPRQDRCQVEAEPVDVHLLGPVAQAVDDEGPHGGVVAVEGVAAAGVVVVLALRGEHVVDAVVDAPVLVFFFGKEGGGGLVG